MPFEAILLYAFFFGIGWLIAFITRRSVILTFFLLVACLMVLLPNHAYRELFHYHLKHPVFWGFAGLIWGYWRDPRRQERANPPLRILFLLLHFLFVKLPVFLIRLLYWLPHALRAMTSREGWANFFRGLFQWIVHLIPPEVRDEWARTFGQGRRPRSRTRTRQSWSWTRNEGQQTQKEDTEAEQRRRPERQERQRREAERRQREEEGQRQAEQQRHESERRQREEQEKQRRAEERQRRRQQRTEEQARRAREAQEEARRQEEREQVKANAKAFAEVGWDMADFPEEDRRYLCPNPNPYEVLGVTPDMTKEQIKKAYRKIAPIYRRRCDPHNPIPVQKRAEEILKVINNAQSRLIKNR